MADQDEYQQSLVDNRVSTTTTGIAYQQARSSGRDRSEYVYSNIEMLQSTKLSLSYCLWIFALIVSLFGVILSTSGFDCIPFCDLGDINNQCAVTGDIGYTMQPSCVDMEQGTWTSQGSFSSSFDPSSSFRIFNRIVLISDTTIDTDQFHPPVIEIRGRTAGGSGTGGGEKQKEGGEESVVLQTIENPEISTSFGGKVVSLSLPDDDTTLPAGVTGFVLRFKKPNGSLVDPTPAPSFPSSSPQQQRTPHPNPPPAPGQTSVGPGPNGPPDGPPNGPPAGPSPNGPPPNLVDDDATSSSSSSAGRNSGGSYSNPYQHLQQTNLQVYYLSESPTFVKAKTVFRYIIIVGGIAVAIEFLFLHSKRVALSDDDVDGISRLSVLFRGKDYRSLGLEHRFTLLFHILAFLSANPVAFWTASNTDNPTWRYLGQNFFPLLKTITVAGAGVVGYVIMGNLHKLGRDLRGIVCRACILSAVFIIPHLVLDGLAAAKGKRSLASTTGTGNKFGLGTLVVEYVWFAVCILIFWRLRNRMVYNAGIPEFYFGRIRTLTLWLRVVMGYFTIYILFSGAIITPVEILVSTVVPLNDSTNFIDIFLVNVLSATALLLSAPRSCDTSIAPPNPWPLYSFSPIAPSSSRNNSAQSLVTVPPPPGTAAPPASTESAGSSGYGSAGPGNGAVVGVLPNNNNNTAAVNIQQDIESRHKWKHITWSSTHFKFTKKFRISGFCFYTEKEEAAFVARHYGVEGFRSFFNWETAFSMLNLSAEVYFDHRGETVLAKQEPSCGERCLRCCAGAEDSGSDDDGDEGIAAPAVSQSAVARTAHAFRASQAGAQTEEEEEESEASTSETTSPTTPATPHDGTKSTYTKTKKQKKSDNSRSENSGKDQGGDSSQASSELMDVTKHGYDLYRCLIIQGVQAIICTHNLPVEGNPPCQPREFGSTFSKHREPHIAIVFRGTINAKNVVTDVNFLRKDYDEMKYDTRGRAKVHAGFFNVWQAMRKPLYEHLDKLYESLRTAPLGGAEHPHRPLLLPIYITGHSLGGAVATLCHYSLAAGGGVQFIQGRCSALRSYTYGMPKVGNQTFTLEFKAKCPESYRVVRENDVVTTMGVCAREHIGVWVSVDRDGNSIVNPNAVEERYAVLSGSGSIVKNHSLDRYAEAFDNVMRAQTSHLIPKQRQQYGGDEETAMCAFGFRSYVAANLEAEREAGAAQAEDWETPSSQNLGGGARGSHPGTAMSRQASVQLTLEEQHRRHRESERLQNAASQRLKERTVEY